MIDGHIHLWRLADDEVRWIGPDHAAILRDFTEADFARAIRGTTIEHAILVQAAPVTAETDRLLGIARGNSRFIGVVGWVDVADPSATGLLRRWCDEPLFLGVRAMVTHGHPPCGLASPALEPVLACLADADRTLDVLVRVEHLASVDALASAHPSLRIVLNHAAKPDCLAWRPGTNGWDAWRGGLMYLAGRPNVWCKLSGFLPLRADLLARGAHVAFVEALLGMFGPDRIVFGSDWPVLTCAASYNAWLSACETAVGSRSAWEAISRRSACAAYRVPCRAKPAR